MPESTRKLAAIVFTDIGRDGMMRGLNVGATVELASSIHIPVIASGGVTSEKDIKQQVEAHLLIVQIYNLVIEIEEQK